MHTYNIQIYSSWPWDLQLINTQHMAFADLFIVTDDKLDSRPRTRNTEESEVSLVVSQRGWSEARLGQVRLQGTHC